MIGCFGLYIQLVLISAKPHLMNLYRGSTFGLCSNYANSWNNIFILDGYNAEFV